MKKFLLSSLVAFITIPGSAVQIGDTLEQVLMEKGKPDNKLQAGSTTLLTYSGNTIKIKDGHVVAMKTAGEVEVSGTTVTAPVTAPAAAGVWTTDYPAAVAQAAKENKKVFLFFTGSDWCGWCKRLDKEILSTTEFKTYAAVNLVLVKLDFPQALPQSGALKAQNRKLAQAHSIQGYPTIIVLNSAGKRVGDLGYMEGGPSGFVKALKSF